MLKCGQVITIVSPNTRQDPLRCYNNLEYYNPIMMYSLTVASDAYKDPQSELLCIDVVGDSGTKNKGQSEGTRKIFLIDIGITDDENEREHMSCGGVTRACLNSISAIEYRDSLLNEENYRNTMKNSLKIWSFNTEEKNLDYFIHFNNQFKK